MPQYRFGPRKTGRLFTVSILVTVVFLAIPSVVNFASPATQQEPENVVLSHEESDWEVRAPGLECEWDPHGMSTQAWWCGETYVIGSSTAWTEDPERTLRRQVRANSIDLDGQSGSVVRAGDNLMYFYTPTPGSLSQPTMALAVRGEGEYDGQVLFAMAQGYDFDELTNVSSALWKGMTGTSMQEELRNHPMFKDFFDHLEQLEELRPEDSSDPFAPLEPEAPLVPSEFASLKES